MNAIIKIIIASIIGYIIYYNITSPKSDTAYYKTINERLSPGKDQNKFNFSYSGEVFFSQLKVNGVKVTIIDNAHDRNKIYETNVKKDSSFSINTELAPGDYQIYSQIPDEKPDSGYWSAFGGKINIDKKGNLLLKTQKIYHKLKIKLISPNFTANGPLTINEIRPTLKWEPFKGANRYMVSWYKDEKNPSIRQNITTIKPEYKIEEDLETGSTYHWSVYAYGLNNKIVAYYSVGSFKTGDELK